jgi:hypothetical protein
MPSTLRILLAVAAIQALVFAKDATAEASLNGFVLEPASIPIDQILRGGPPRDGIPALDSPQVVAAADAPWSSQERVIGIESGGVARAYPLSILVWHELVNDTLGGVPLLVSYCPLCGTALVFDRRIDERVHRFGVSGLLYRSDLLMFDRETESLWSQIAGRAVTGPVRDQRLQLIRSRTTRWGDWKQAFPETTVLSAVTGHRREYARSPYRDYASSRRLMFPVDLDRRYHPKLPTLGLRMADGRARAYPSSEIERAGGQVNDRFAGHEVTIRYDPDAKLFDVEAPDELEVIEGFWFAWAAFHPEGEVFDAEGEVFHPEGEVFDAEARSAR